MNVEHRTHADGGAFVIERDGERNAELTYQNGPGARVVTADHTWTDPSLRGQGVAGALLDAFVAWARAEQLRVVPACSYVARAFEQRPELAELRAP